MSAPAGPCPSWCTTDHTRLLIPGKPEYGSNASHWSDISAHTDELMVRLTQYSSNPPEVCVTTVYGQFPVFLNGKQSGQLAALLRSAPGEAEALAALLLAAAAALAGEETA